jgi:REP element-mobilizing transposase RayT
VYHRRPPRLPNSEYVGPVRIFFTMNTFRRHRHFTTGDVVGPARDQLLRTGSECAVETVAYCFMPDHLHALLIGLETLSNVGTCADRFKRRAGLDFRRLDGGRLWQEGHFDRSLRSSEVTIDVVAYILNNPVRAGLCKAPDDYPFSGSSRYSVEDIVDAMQWRPDAIEW